MVGRIELGSCLLSLTIKAGCRAMHHDSYRAIGSERLVKLHGETHENGSGADRAAERSVATHRCLRRRDCRRHLSSRGQDSELGRRRTTRIGRTRDARLQARLHRCKARLAAHVRSESE